MAGEGGTEARLYLYNKLSMLGLGHSACKGNAQKFVRVHSFLCVFSVYCPTRQALNKKKRQDKFGASINKGKHDKHGKIIRSYTTGH